MIALLSLLGCLSGSVAVPQDDASVPASPALPGTLPATPPPAATPPATAPPTQVPTPPPSGQDACRLDEGTCTAWNEGQLCVQTSAGTRWETQTCGGGEGCLRGSCLPQQCADECYAGQTNGSDTCELYDVAQGGWVGLDDDNRLADRARTFERWLRKDTESLFHDGIVSVKYTDSSRTDVDSIYVGDTALHSGVYLAAEALRLQETGGERSRRNVKHLVEYTHRLFSVSGDPGMLATHVVPAGDNDIRDWTDWDCNDFDRHCNVTWDGQQWDYIGEPSRDMYMGPLLGLVPAYDALTGVDEAHRELIRQDLVAVAMELKRARTLNIRFEVNGFVLPPVPMAARFFIPESADQAGSGTITASIDIGDLDNSGEIHGGQEFFPNPMAFFRQSALVPNNLPDIPRSSSAMMVPAMLLAAIHVTEDQPQWATERAELLDFYENNNDAYGNVEDWIDLAASYTNTRECGERYFGVNLAVIPLSIWVALEHDAARRDEIKSRVWPRVWNEVHDHKNPFFDFAYAGNHPGADVSIATEAAFQTHLFRAPPRIDYTTDLSNSPNYDEDDDCPGLSSTALDVDDRPADFFQWHAHPWELEHDGNARQTYPGHDFLLAYWLGRRSGWIDDEAPQRCLRWR